MFEEKIDYILMLVRLFARHFGLSFLEAYRYISRYDGVEYSERHYDILHTLSFADQVEGLASFCHSRGGELM